MSTKIDLSGFKKEDIEVVSLSGKSYIVPGNFSAEFTVKVYDTFKELKEAEEKEDIISSYEILKKWIYEFINIGDNKITMEEVTKEFGDDRLMKKLLETVFELAV